MRGFLDLLGRLRWEDLPSVWTVPFYGLMSTAAQKGRKWTELRHSSLCFRTMGAVEPATSSCCCWPSSPWWARHSNSEPNETLPSLNCFLLKKQKSDSHQLSGKDTGFGSRQNWEWAMPPPPPGMHLCRITCLLWVSAPSHSSGCFATEKHYI